MSLNKESFLTLIESIAADWDVDSHHAVHKSGIEVWVANGMPHYKIDRPFKASFSWPQRLKFHKFIERIKSEKVILKLGYE